MSQAAVTAADGSVGDGTGSEVGGGEVPDEGEADGDSPTFEAFVGESLPRLLRFARLVSGSPHDADDLVQDALARTGARWGWVVRGEAEAYVRRAIVNGHVSRWRRRRRESLMAVLPEPGTGETVLADRHGDLWHAVKMLPRRQRAVLALRYYEDLSEARTAELLGISVGTVKSQTSKALASLRAATVNWAVEEQRR